MPRLRPSFGLMRLLLLGAGCVEAIQCYTYKHVGSLSDVGEGKTFSKTVNCPRAKSCLRFVGEYMLPEHFLGVYHEWFNDGGCGPDGDLETWPQVTSFWDANSLDLAHTFNFSCPMAESENIFARQIAELAAVPDNTELHQSHTNNSWDYPRMIVTPTQEVELMSIQLMDDEANDWRLNGSVTISGFTIPSHSTLLREEFLQDYQSGTWQNQLYDSPEDDQIKQKLREYLFLYRERNDPPTIRLKFRLPDEIEQLTIDGTVFEGNASNNETVVAIVPEILTNGTEIGRAWVQHGVAMKYLWFPATHVGSNRTYVVAAWRPMAVYPYHDAHIRRVDMNLPRSLDYLEWTECISKGWHLPVCYDKFQSITAEPLDCSYPDPSGLGIALLNLTAEEVGASGGSVWGVPYQAFLCDTDFCNGSVQACAMMGILLALAAGPW